MGNEDFHVKLECTGLAAMILIELFFLVFICFMFYDLYSEDKGAAYFFLIWMSLFLLPVFVLWFWIIEVDSKEIRIKWPFLLSVRIPVGKIRKFKIIPKDYGGFYSRYINLGCFFLICLKRWFCIPLFFSWGISSIFNKREFDEKFMKVMEIENFFLRSKIECERELNRKNKGG